MRCTWTQDPSLVPQHITVRLDNSNLERTFTMRFWTFTEGLRDYTPAGLPGSMGADKFMLLCFGLAGSGKSSFFNSVLTLMHEGRPCLITFVQFCIHGPSRIALVHYSAAFALLVVNMNKRGLFCLLPFHT